MTPPRGALLLMRLLLPRDLREPISGDIEEEWNLAARPSRLRFWNLALRSVAACWIDRAFRWPRRVRVEHGRPRGGESRMQGLRQDLRYGARLLWRSPGFTTAAVATLALGIGANSAIFSLLDVLSWKPLPYRDPARVAFVLGRDADTAATLFSLRLADYVDLQARSQSMEGLAAYTYVSANLTGGDVPERVQAYRVTTNTFALLGVPAALGRVFEPADGQEGRDDVVILSHGSWQRRFGGDASIIGRRVVVNGRPCEIVGVMPPRFEFPIFNFKGDLWMPWPLAGAARGQPASMQSATVVGRLRAGVSYARAQADLDTLMASIATDHPETNRALRVRVVEMGRLDDEEAGPAMAILVVTVALVLALACANVANLLLARGVARHRELAVRVALGATRGRIARQLLLEGVLLALAGGAAGVLLAGLALRSLRSLLPEMILTTMPNVEELGVDGRTLVFTLAIALLTSVMFGLVPAWRASRGDLQGGLRESASTGGSRGTRRLRSLLVVGEVALSTLLLVGAGLLARSYRGLRHVDPGFSPDGVVTMALSLPDYTYASAAQRRRFYEQAIGSIEQLGSVRSAGFVNVLPFSTYDRGTRLIVEGAPPPAPGREPSVAYRIASPRYFETLRIPVVEGRPFDARDRADGAPVAIVNRTLARRFLGASSPLGRHIGLGVGSGAPWLTIVGVIGDVHHSQLAKAPDPEVYVPMAQVPAPMMMLAVRGDGRSDDLTAAVRAEILRIDPTQPVYHVRTMGQLLADSLLPRSISAALMTVFSGLALVLAMVGVYGVIAYGVSQQTREFGLRVALGATPRDLLRLVLGQGVLMVGVGVALGAAAALGASRLLATALYGVGHADPQTYLTVVVLLVLAGLLACSVPAWRASRVAPVAALRME